MDRSPAQTALLPASQALDPSRSVPAVLERAGANALFAADEFFAARISNPHTRRAYARVVRRFLAWCEDEHLELPQVSPGLAGRFIDELPGDSSTKNQALAGLRHFFDTLVTRHAAPLNPFQSVRGRKHDTTDGKTPGLSIPQARDLLALDRHLPRRGPPRSGSAGNPGLHRGPRRRRRPAAARGSGGPGAPARSQVPGKGRQAAGDPRPPRPRPLARGVSGGGRDRRPIPKRLPCSARPWASKSSSPTGPCQPTPWASC